MAVVVQKFGGSSLASSEKIAKVAELVAATRRAGHEVVVVVSAMGKTTDELMAKAREVSRAPDGSTVDPPRRELDMLVSSGERMSMALIAIAIAGLGLEVISFTGSQSGIITNDRHFDARIIEVRPHRIEDELARGKIVIVAGYQGMSYKREITTLGRGGSDTTAVALSAALDAERCEIYSDVDGVYSADPRVVPGALHLAEIDYEAMQEMAEAGAKVLNAQAVEWARRQKVKIHARRTADFSPGSQGRETVVQQARDSEAGPNAGVTIAVVAEHRLARVSVEASSSAALLELLREREVSLRETMLAQGRCVALLPLWSLPDQRALRVALEAGKLAGLAWEEGLGSVSVIGVGIGSDPGALRRALGACGDPPLAVTSSALRLTFQVPDNRVSELERALHETFVEGKG